MSILGNWALVYWTDNVNLGGVLIASKASGAWAKVTSGGGDVLQSDVQTAGVDAATAQFLIANARPLPPTNGYSRPANGSSSQTVTSESCINDTVSPPQRYRQSWTTGSSVLSYSSASVQPTGPNSAVVADVTVSTGSAIVSILSPSNALLKQNMLRAGQSGGVGYFDALAPVGIYTVTVAGPSAESMDPQCGNGTAVTSTDAVWNGLLSW